MFRALTSRSNVASLETAPRLFSGKVHMLKWFRRLVEAIECLTSALEKTNSMREQGASVIERVEHLELTRAAWEAEVEGSVMKADGKLRAANNAEARARTMEKHVEKQLDPFGEEGEEIQERISARDVEGSEEDSMQPVHVAVAVNNKTRALRMKFG